MPWRISVRARIEMIDPIALARALLLLGIANSAPIFAKRLLGARLRMPLDAGLIMPDGRPLFGVSKTIRGIVVSLFVTSIAAPILGLGWSVGASLAAASMAGDLLSSFVKRRMGLAPHAQAFILDQTPEALLPMLLLRAPLGLGWGDVAVGLAIFIGLEVVLSRLLFRLHIRDRPY
jgi:CDP-2,3-bis-(O-geranylgeranyl)-sn-glycerol synthase